MSPAESAGYLLEAVRYDLAEERARKASIESRAVTLIGAATASIALLFGLGLDYTGERRGALLIVVGASALLFVGTITLGITASAATKLPRAHRWQLSKVANLIAEWQFARLPAEPLLGDLIEATIVALGSARRLNQEKAEAFRWAMRFVFAAGVGVFIVIVIAIAGLI